jgi:integrase
MATITPKFAVRGLKNGRGRISIEVYIDRNTRKLVKTDIRLLPTEWDADKHQVIKHPLSVEYNYSISKELTKLQKLAVESTNNEKPLTIRAIDALINNDQSNEVFNAFIDVQKEKEIVSKGTYINFCQALKTFNAFNPKVTFRMIDFQLIREYNAFLVAKGLKDSTVVANHRIIKKFLNLAINFGLFPGDITKNPYHTFKLRASAGSKDFLTYEEIMSIYNAQYKTLSERKAADVFVFACFTGMRISDIKLLTPEKIHQNYLKYTPKKTAGSSGVTVELPIATLFSGKPLEILLKYNMVLPVLKKDDDYNKLLKYISLFVGIKKHVTSHVARHSFLTAIAWITGSVYQVMNLGGLTEPKTAMLYTHMAKSLSENELGRVVWPSLPALTEPNLPETIDIDAVVETVVRKAV